jgi:FixJ family two-component response regulator
MSDHTPSFLIAVVDDDQSLLQSIASLLESADFTVRRFSSALALIDSSSLSEIDCLISDVDMPITDGLALLRVVREAHANLPVIFLTGHPEMLNRSPSAGSDNYRVFTKPFKGHELLAAVSEVLKDRHPYTLRS